MQKVIIVGGVAGGASAAARLRRLDENIEIIMFERGSYISFANCGLPYYIGGTIKERDALLIQTPEAMKARFNMDIRIDSEIVAINRDKKTVTVNELKTGRTYEESYDTLVLSPGSSPIRPNIPGIDSPNIFTLWNIPDTDAIKHFVDTHPIKTATVIGGGFIGIEMVENLHVLGIDVTVVEMADQVLTPIDYEMAQIVHHHLSNKGIRLYLKNGVKSFSYKDGVTEVELQDGTTVTSDLVILSIGVSPNGHLAKTADLKVNNRGGIIVDQYLKTSDPSIYAVGDAIEVIDYVNQIPAMIPLAGPANKQGRMVANNIVGRLESYEGTQGTSVAKVFDLTVASTGANEKALNRLGKEYGKDYLITIVQPKSHAGYYPGALPMTLKVIFDMEGKILGAQNVGYEGIEKRIDVIATAMRFGGTIYDLKKLELAYAPPYSSAKDPVNLAGFAAENILNHDQNPILWREIDGLDPEKTLILDVREPIEFSLGAIEKAKLMPVNDIRNRLSELPKDKELVVYCAVGLRGYIATRILSENGYNVKNLLGGYSLYKTFITDYTNPRCDVDDLEPPLGDDGAPEEKEALVKAASINATNVITLNACGLQCPGPIMQVSTKIHELKPGDILEVSATDPGFAQDVQAWCKKTGNTFLKAEKADKAFVITLRKEHTDVAHPIKTESLEDSTMVVFSGDLDKALAAMIIANGSVAMGKKVTLFFTFWGLNILRKPDKVSVSKSLIEKMFGMMMPRGSSKLKLSKMHMSGMGTSMIKKVMKDKNVNSLEELIQSAKDSGVRLVACTMSMDLMGIKKEELIDGIEFGGVASYLGATDKANHNLFI